MRKLQDQNETHQANRAKMAEGMALALDKKDQVSIISFAPRGIRLCVFIVRLIPVFVCRNGWKGYLRWSRYANILTAF